MANAASSQLDGRDRPGPLVGEIGKAPKPAGAYGHPTALSTLPPAVTGFAATNTKAMTQGAVPLFTQLWMVPRCTSTSPALRCTLVPSSSNA